MLVGPEALDERRQQTSEAQRESAASRARWISKRN